MDRLAKGLALEVQTIVPDKLYAAEFIRDNGLPLYFVYERVDNSNEKYWRTYQQWAEYIARLQPITT